MIKIEINLSAGQKKRTAYLKDLTDRQREIICSMLQYRASGGRPRKRHLREIVCAVLYILRSGCSRADAPSRFPGAADRLLLFQQTEKDRSAGTFSRQAYP